MSEASDHIIWLLIMPLLINMLTANGKFRLESDASKTVARNCCFNFSRANGYLMDTTQRNYHKQFKIIELQNQN